MIVPNYDFKCETCNTILEVQDPAPLPCTICGNTMVRIWASVAVKFNGSGFYSTGGQMYTFTDTVNCEGTDTEAFFTQNDKGTYNDKAMLQKICGNCKVVNECLDYALRHEVMGYWGNTTENQRHKLRSKLNIISRPLYMDYNQEELWNYM